jgi:hypothetical protein
MFNIEMSMSVTSIVSTAGQERLLFSPTNGRLQENTVYRESGAAKRTNHP